MRPETRAPARRATVVAATLLPPLVLVGSLGVAARGDPTALLCVGSDRALPADAGRAVRFEGSPGYDGQFYALVALDPLDRSATSAFLDDPGRRYGRILLPLLAGVFRPRDLRGAAIAFAAWNLLACAAVGHLAASFARGSRRPVALALAASLQPGLSVAVSRGLPGPLGLALTLAALRLRGRGRAGLAGVLLAIAPLDHEVYAVVPLALAALSAARRSREAAFALALAPVLAWRAFLHAKGLPGAWPLGDLGPPFAGLVEMAGRRLEGGIDQWSAAFDLLHAIAFLALPVAALRGLAPADRLVFFSLWGAAVFADADVWVSFWSSVRATTPVFALACLLRRGTAVPLLAGSGAALTLSLPVWFSFFPPRLTVPT